MSHLSHIKTQIKNAQILQEVLQELITDEVDGILTGATLEYNAAIQDPFGNSKIAEFVIRRTQNYKGGYDFGFKLTESGEYEFLCRDGSKYYGEKFLQALMPKYAHHQTIATLQEQGFTIESEVEENGQIKLIAGKWA